MRRWIIALIAAAALASCSQKAQEPFKDAPRSGQVNSAPADNIRMPDGFSNVATKCDHGNRLYVAYHGDHSYAAIQIAPNDPTCRPRGG